MNKSRVARVVLYAVFIFVAGAITGALVAPMIGRSFMRLPDSRQMSGHMLAHLRSGLDLTDEQMAKIKPVIENTCADMETLHRETTKRALDRIAETNAKISAFLTPEQKAKFQKMEAEHSNRIRHTHHFGATPGPPPPGP
jgi:Spy/CpxP family protein refolding chaperone